MLHPGPHRKTFRKPVILCGCEPSITWRRKLTFERFEIGTIRRAAESLQTADSVEKHRVADAESGFEFSARAPFLSGFGHLLRCRKDLGQFTEVLGGCGEQEFVICTAWAT